MKYAIEVSDEVQFEVDVPPNMPAPTEVSVSFEAETAMGVRDLIAKLGGSRRFSLNPTSPLQVRYGVPVTRDGERVGRATLHVWLSGDLRQPDPQYPVIRELIATRDSRARAGRVVSHD